MRAAPEWRKPGRMSLVRLSVLGLTALSLGAGCGLLREDIDTDISVDFTVDRPTLRYDNEISVNPSDYQEVKENCASLEAETGRIRRILFEVTRNDSPDPANQLGWGLVHMRGPTKDPWPDLEDLNPADAIGDFQAVPLAPGQVMELDVSAAQRAKIAKFVFTPNCDQEVQMKMHGRASSGPVKFAGRITFQFNVFATP